MFRSIRRGRAEPVPAYHAGRPLLRLSKRDAWTIGDSFEGTQVFGATGSGKTSGSGAAIARAMLAEGYGGLVLTAKPDERAAWERYCAQTGRSDSLVVFGIDGAHRFNFLDYELRRPGGGLTEAIVEVFGVVMSAINAGSSGSNEAYFEQARDQLLRNAIDLLRFSEGTLSLTDLLRVIRTGPRGFEDLDDPGWRESSFCAQCLTQALGKAGSQVPSDLEETVLYWTEEFPGLPDRTRASITSTFTTAADGLVRSPMRELFCSTTTVVPELTHQGVVLVIDLPIKSYHRVARIAQLIWKTMWQRATESRTGPALERPVFLWADEAQEFATARDAKFQATARSARAATVYLTQNIPGYLASLAGKAEAQAATDSMLGNFQTKIFHANGDAVTNEWASKAVASDWVWRTSTSTNNQPKQDGRGHVPAVNASSQQSFDPQVPPIRFTQLRKGGPASGFLVDGIVFQGGRRWWGTGKNWIEVSFQQG